MNNKIKVENRKYFKKFMLIIFVAALLGGMAGFMLSVFGGELKEVPKYLNMILIYIIPYSICVTGGVLFILWFMLYKKSKKLYENYDEENEQLINTIENINGYSMIISNINLILTFLFFGVGAVLDDYIFDLDNNFYKCIVFFLSYVVNIAIIVKIQQKQIDFEKVLNPEKRGSVYDTKFAEKWEESCDERERLMIYKSSYKVFKNTNRACIAIWVILVLINTVWNVGIMPVLIITIIWAILICSYSIESIKLQKNVRK